MPDTDESPLWPISSFEQRRSEASGRDSTLVASTLQAELHGLRRFGLEGDVLHVVAACVRLREPALLYLECERRVWPVTLFPREMSCHAPVPLAHASDMQLAGLRLLDIDPPSARPPGAWMHAPDARAQDYQPLLPVLWAIALRGPSSRLLAEIGGTAAYRALHLPKDDGLPTPGALGAAVEHLRRETMAVPAIAKLPGMSTERAQRLLNALYLSANLMVSRAHPAARASTLRPR